jgi:H+-transporting ATPase
MRLVLGIATVLGVIGPVAAFGLFYVGDQVLHLGHPQLQTLMYLMLSVAGHLTIFLTRTRGPFWSIRPSRVLVVAVFGTQALATLIAVFGLFMTPLGWGLALLVWVYAVAWFLVNDRIKLLAYRILDPTGAPLLGRKPPDRTPQIAARAYELYEQRVRGEGQAARDWLQAEREIRREDAKPAPDAAPEPHAELKPDAKAEPEPEADAKPEASAKPAPDAAPEPHAEPKPDAKAEPEPEAKPAPKPDAKAEPNVTPQTGHASPRPVRGARARGRSSRAGLGQGGHAGPAR